MPKYFVQLTNDEFPSPLYVEIGLGFAGVRLTDDLRRARRYETLAEAEKIAASANAQKAKERGGELTTVEIVTEIDSDEAAEQSAPVQSGEPASEPQPAASPPEPPQPPQTDDGWETRFRFEQVATGKEALFQMKKTPEGIKSRYITFEDMISEERPASEIDKSFLAFCDCVRAWVIAKIHNKR